MHHRFTEPTPVASTVDIVTLFIPPWEIECCAPPPQVGEPSTWQLLDEQIVDGHTVGTAHGGQHVTSTVTGEVLSVRLVTHDFRENDDGVWTPVPGSASYTRVFRSPRWFRKDHVFVPGRTCRTQSGVLVELAVSAGGMVPNVDNAAESVFLADL